MHLLLLKYQLKYQHPSQLNLIIHNAVQEEGAELLVSGRGTNESGSFDNNLYISNEAQHSDIQANLNDSKQFATEHIPKDVFKQTLQNRGQRFLLKTWHDPRRKQAKAKMTTNLKITNEARVYESIHNLANQAGSMFSPGYKESGELGETGSFEGAEKNFKHLATSHSYEKQFKTMQHNVGPIGLNQSAFMHAAMLENDLGTLI